MFSSDEIYVYTKEDTNITFPDNFLIVPQIGDIIESKNPLEQLKVIRRIFRSNEIIEIEVQRIHTPNKIQEDKIITLKDTKEIMELDADGIDLQEYRHDNWFEDPDMGDHN